MLLLTVIHKIPFNFSRPSAGQPPEDCDPGEKDPRAAQNVQHDQGGLGQHRSAQEKVATTRARDQEKSAAEIGNFCELRAHSIS